MDTNDYQLNWAVQLRRGWLELCVLNALAGGERYGYDLARTLAALPGENVTEGTLYPLLSRLRLQGLVFTRLEESSGGPARKYYALTAAGRRAVEKMNAHIEDMVAQSRRLREHKERK
jgi:PadR family transcriptional regulator PadR